MGLLNMVGAAPSRTPTSSLPEDEGGKSHRDKQLHEFNERLQSEDEEIILILAQFITTNNSN